MPWLVKEPGPAFEFLEEPGNAVVRPNRNGGRPVPCMLAPWRSLAQQQIVAPPGSVFGTVKWDDGRNDPALPKPMPERRHCSVPSSRLTGHDDSAQPTGDLVPEQKPRPPAVVSDRGN